MPRNKTDKETIKRSKKMLELIKIKRSYCGYTQESLAKKSGVSVDVIRSIEKGAIKTPSIFTFLDLRKALKIKWKDIENL